MSGEVKKSQAYTMDKNKWQNNLKCTKMQQQNKNDTNHKKTEYAEKLTN